MRTIGELLPPDQIDALRASLPPLPPKAPAPPPPAPAAAAEPAGEAMDTDAATAPGEDAAAAGEAAAAPAPEAAAATTAAAADGAAADATGTAGAQTTPQPPASTADTNAEASTHAEATDAAAAEEEGEEAPLKDAWLQRCEAAYTAAAAELSWRTPFEEAIKRYYFHIKPLDAAQQANWSSYLEAAEGKLGGQEGGLAALVVLYERCLVPCARYSGKVDIMDVRRCIGWCARYPDSAVNKRSYIPRLLSSNPVHLLDAVLAVVCFESPPPPHTHTHHTTPLPAPPPPTISHRVLAALRSPPGGRTQPRRLGRK